MNILRTILYTAIFSSLTILASGQCEPDTAGCLDPEENGQICPDTLAIGFLNQVYDEHITILVPEKPNDSAVIPIHHLTLVDIENMPPGLTWESNAPDDEFMAEHYYCIRISGTPTEKGTYYFKIIVDVYVDFNGIPLFATQEVDSTSVFLEIAGGASLPEVDPGKVEWVSAAPSPFNGQVFLEYQTREPAELLFEVYNLTGQRCHQEGIMAKSGKNTLHFNGDALPAGLYLFRLSGPTVRPVTLKLARN